jgi:hypothetical protein
MRRDWVDIGQLAIVDLTSEDPGFPLEFAFGFDGGPGWRASEGGEQQIRIIVDKPVSMHPAFSCGPVHGNEGAFDRSPTCRTTPFQRYGRGRSDSPGRT